MAQLEGEPFSEFSTAVSRGRFHLSSFEWWFLALAVCQDRSAAEIGGTFSCMPRHREHAPRSVHPFSSGDPRRMACRERDDEAWRAPDERWTLITCCRMKSLRSRDVAASTNACVVRRGQCGQRLAPPSCYTRPRPHALRSSSTPDGG